MFFATHYFFSNEDLNDFGKLAYKRMAYEVISDGDIIERLNFLYRLENGICDKSFALNAALMAGIDRKIVERAEAITASYRLQTNI